MRVAWRRTWAAYATYFKSLGRRIYPRWKLWALPFVIAFVFVMYVLVDILGSVMMVKRYWMGYQKASE